MAVRPYLAETQRRLLYAIVADFCTITVNYNGSLITLARV